jgi:hypothetical protein
MKYIFSYVLFGNDDKYFHPLIQNISFIRENFGENGETFIYCIDISSNWINQLKAFEDVNLRLVDGMHSASATLKMMQRYNVVKEVSPEKACFLFRDADSLLTPTEIKIIKHWSQSKFGFSVIRDHYDHVMPLMGGLIGCKEDCAELLNKKLNLIENDKQNFNAYGYDQVFLDRNIYREFSNDILTYSSSIVFFGETVVDISQSKGTIGGYSNTIDKKKKCTMLPLTLFRLLNYRGASLRLSGWHWVDIIDSIS